MLLPEKAASLSAGRTKHCLAFLMVVVAGSQELATARAAEAPQYNRDVRPIFANHCFKCHGPDEQTREAGLRLDRREAALAAAESVIYRSCRASPTRANLCAGSARPTRTEQMPRPAANKPLSDGSSESC